MTVGGVTGADFLCETVLLVFSLILYSSDFFLITSVCQPLSVPQLVILANAGTHYTASVVVWYFRFIASAVVSFALCCCLLWRVHFQMRHPACVEEWIPVCAGMTVSW
ncbi:hypothetical protein RFS42_002413 [Vibrio vulnificus]|nr:hypothetical protein [Vibrio vulnificus]